MIANNISFKANPIQKKGVEVASNLTKKMVEELPEYVSPRTVFDPKVTKAAEEANELAKKANLAADTVDFVNHRAAIEITEEVDEYTKLNQMIAEANNKPTIINGKEVKVGEKIDIQG